MTNLFTNLVQKVVISLKWTKWTKWTEQIFVESAESAKSAKSIFATFATFASANFVGKASCESTVRYRERSRIPSCLLRYSLDSDLSRFSLASLICLCMLTVGVGNVWGATETLTMSEMGWDNAEAVSSVSASSATISVSANSSTNDPAFYISDYTLRIYGIKKTTTGGSIAFTAVDEITQIAFTCSFTNSGTFNASTGTYNSSTKTWTKTGNLTIGNSVEFIVTNNAKNNPQAKITEIAITYKAKVTFNANGGSCATSSLTQSTPTSTITLPTPTRSGFTCTGWYTAESGGTKRGNAGATYTPSASETLYAHWESSCSPLGSINGSFFWTPLFEPFGLDNS